MTKEEKFAIAMSELLFDMRNEDLANTIVLDDDGNQIPVDFIDKILEDDNHQKVMKEKIRETIMNTFAWNPNSFNKDDEGNYVYTAPNTYDYAYFIDDYIQAMYADTQTRTIYQCTHCLSDNVQVKAWVRPNEGMKYVDEVNEGDELGWCDACQQNVYVETVEVKRRAHIIGYQVLDDAHNATDMHPHMEASFCVYNLDQARSMLDDDNQGDERGKWQLVTIWDDTIEEPTMMFEGLPRA